MAVNESSTRGGVGSIIQVLVGIAALGAIILIALPHVNVGALALPLALPTAAVVPQEQQRRVVVPPVRDAAPVQTQIDAYNATAEAVYQDAIAPAPIENTGQGVAPAVIQQRAAPERLPAGENVPTAAPVVQTQIDGAFGSKPAKPVNIQGTKTCKHGQVWTDRGCKNPTPVQ